MLNQSKSLFFCTYISIWEVLKVLIDDFDSGQSMKDKSILRKLEFEITELKKKVL